MSSRRSSATTHAEIRKWLGAGRALVNVTHMLVVCDTFDGNYYPIYARSVDEVRRDLVTFHDDEKKMSRVVEIYSYGLDLEEQLHEKFAWHILPGDDSDKRKEEERRKVNLITALGAVTGVEGQPEKSLSARTYSAYVLELTLSSDHRERILVIQHDESRLQGIYVRDDNDPLSRLKKSVKSGSDTEHPSAFSEHRYGFAYDGTDAIPVKPHDDEVMARLRRLQEAPEEREWQVWTEGYAATGEHGTAKFQGVVRARTFKEACDQAFAGSEHYDAQMLTLWGCRLFKDEAAARASFG